MLTSRLLLWPLEPGDVDLGIEMFTDPDVMRYVGGLLSADKIRSEMPNYLKRCGGGCIGIWCVIERSTSGKIGTGALLPMPVEEDDTNWDLVEGPDIPASEIEVGYILKCSAWDKGYATEICKRLLAFAFEETPLQEVVACIDDDNHKSRHVLVKCGFRAEGRRLAYGVQSPYFRITPSHWWDAHSVRSE
ncbi:MAG: GNAT family N-acetyltransferase [Gammaproteobacteria bacterium]